MHSIELDKLPQCASAIANDPVTFGIDCTQTLLRVQELHVKRMTDIYRLKEDAVKANQQSGIATEHADVLIIANATLITMQNGNLESDLMLNGTVVIRGGVIESVTNDPTFSPPLAAVINAEGGPYI